MKALVGLVQACHRLSVHAASLSGNFSGQGLEDAIDAFVNPDVEEETEDVDYMNLPLGVQPKDEKKPSSGPCPTFMSIDLRALLSASKTGDDVNLNEMFLEKTLSFVRDHLLSKPLLMAVATAADRAERDPARSSEADEEVQEGFLLLCEVTPPIAFSLQLDLRKLLSQRLMLSYYPVLPTSTRSVSSGLLPLQLMRSYDLITTLLYSWNHRFYS